ncbi:MAG: DUF4268 domain-containing protein [Thioalkalivibrio sp.]|nr:DUF4268 domain-containing protein [Thioalkalivibrio sp.]
MGATLVSMDRIGRIEELGIRDVWKHEAHDFTRWLYDNLDQLGDPLGIELTGALREAPTGSFSLDILAMDADGRRIVIENQFGNSDHDHLGKVLTYLASFDSDVAIWIVENARPEHVDAIHWLNKSAASTEFFLLQIEVIRIEESPPAPRFTIIAAPSEEQRQIGAQKRSLANQAAELHAFWSDLLEVSRDRHPLHAGISSTTKTWLRASSGVPGITFTYGAYEHAMKVELSIERGDEDTSERAFRALEDHKNEIEDIFGQPLVWELLPGRKRCRIKHDLAVAGYRDPEKRTEVITAAVDAMARLEAAIRAHLNEIR